MNSPDQIHPSDRWTRNADRVTGMLLLKDPVRTSLGVVLGGTLSFLNLLFAPALQAVTFANFAAVPSWGWLSLGILIMHFRTIMYLLKRPSVGCHEIDKLFAAIERADLSPAERRQCYRRLIDRLLEDAVAEHSRRPAAAADKALHE